MLKRREFLKLSSIGALSIIGTSSLSFAKKEKSKNNISNEISKEENTIYEYDKNGNLIYCKSSQGIESWLKYDERNNGIYFKNTDGYEWWHEYDENNNKIYSKVSDKYPGDYEEWFKYDKNNNLIYRKYKTSTLITEQGYKYDKSGRPIEHIKKYKYK